MKSKEPSFVQDVDSLRKATLLIRFFLVFWQSRQHMGGLFFFATFRTERTFEHAFGHTQSARPISSVSQVA